MAIVQEMFRTACVVLTGNPNCGKTTLFNALTGLRAKVGNYGGVTVERKEGRLKGVPPGLTVTVLDLPGTYSLSPRSLDEQIARDVLFHRVPDVAPPDLAIIVVDASNLQRSLYYVTQVIELGWPAVVALNMIDVAEANGHRIDAGQLASALGVPVIRIVASLGHGVAELRSQILQSLQRKAEATPLGEAKAPCFSDLPVEFRQEAAAIARMLDDGSGDRVLSVEAEATLLLGDERVLSQGGGRDEDEVGKAVKQARDRLSNKGIDWRSAVIEARYARVAEICAVVTTENASSPATPSDKLDRVLTHRYWGLVILVGIMALMFQSIFTFAKVPMELLQGAVSWIGGLVGRVLPPGDLHSLLVDGVTAGVGAVVVFLPQICLLFLFIGLLEDTGYMARAAFLIDRIMSKVGLHGKSFIPMLSCFACAVPGIMATRTIENPKDRLVTILVAPLMSCSARLPVYTLLIAACVPDIRILGVFKLTGLTMLGMYLLGIVAALVLAWLFKKTLLRGDPPVLILELPPYRRPVLRVLLRYAWDRSRLFLHRAGTVILGINILLWFLATYPRNKQADHDLTAQKEALQTVVFPGVTDPKASEALKMRKQVELEQAARSQKLQTSFAGRLGRALEPVIAPLGFDWKIGVGLIASFAAREVLVSTLAVVYSVGTYDRSETSLHSLAETLRGQTRPDGTPLFTPLTAITLMVFYVFALQCVSTVAIVRRETNSWRWPLFQWVYLGALAWILAFVTYQGGRLLGFR
jgi:ferrous iron transport protein B